MLLPRHPVFLDKHIQHIAQVPVPIHSGTCLLFKGYYDIKEEYLQNNKLRIQLKFDGLINPSKVCHVFVAYDDHSFPIRKKLTPRLTMQILDAIGFVHSNKHNVGAPRIWVTVIYQRVGAQYYKHVLAGAPIDNNQELYVEQVPNEELSFNIEDQV